MKKMISMPASTNTRVNCRMRRLYCKKLKRRVMPTRARGLQCRGCIGKSTAGQVIVGRGLALPDLIDVVRACVIRAMRQPSRR